MQVLYNLLSFGFAVLKEMIVSFFTNFLFTFTGWEASVYDQKYVLITGCDSGFGKELALRLANKGVKVFANCYSNETAEKLKKECSNDNITTLVFDVTDYEKCMQAAGTVSEIVGRKGLYGLVNNAGIAEGYLSDLTPIETYQKVMDVNYYGAVNMCIAFIPLVKKAGTRGLPHGARIVNMTSCAGRTSCPGLGAYCASKHALEAYSDALRREMTCWNIKVSIIEPFFMNTAIIDKGRVSANRIVNTSEVAQNEYGEEFFEKEFQKRELVSLGLYSPSKVVDAYESSLIDAYPKQRYIVGAMGYAICYAFNFMPAFLLDALVARDYKPKKATRY